MSGVSVEKDNTGEGWENRGKVGDGSESSKEIGVRDLEIADKA